MGYRMSPVWRRRSYSIIGPGVTMAQSIICALTNAREAASWQAITMMESFKQLFARQAGPWVLVRNLGLRLVDRLSWIKNQFIAQRMGYSN